MTRALTPETVHVTNQSTVQLALIALIAATVARLFVQVGIGTLPTAHRAAAYLGATQVQHLTSAAKTWDWQSCPPLRIN